MKLDSSAPDIIVEMLFGSRLYGTFTKDSDIDHKGIFMPTKEQIFLNRIPRTFSYHSKTECNRKNTSEDTDSELYSLHYFIFLACEGNTNALDMLHAPDDAILVNSDIWREIVSNRYRFYTKRMKAYTGYAKSQAFKYGVKGSRLNAAKVVLSFCDMTDLDLLLKDVWEVLPTREHLYKLDACDKGLRMYEVCGRKVHETAMVGYLKEIVERFYKNYGARAEQAARNEGIDWKAISHALRAAFQVKQIFIEKTITFPFPYEQANYLKQVKAGAMDYKEVASKLDGLLEEIEKLSSASDLPEHVDKEFWDRFLFTAVGRSETIKKYIEAQSKK